MGIFTCDGFLDGLDGGLAWDLPLLLLEPLLPFLFAIPPQQVCLQSGCSQVVCYCGTQNPIVHAARVPGQPVVVRLQGAGQQKL